MNQQQIIDVVQKQRDFFNSGKTLDVNFRIEHLKKLKAAFKKYESEMIEAVKTDMGRADVETYFMELHMNMEELDYALKHINDWTDDKKVKTPTLFFMAESRLYPEPYGIALIISAWNFPLLQLFSPLIGAIAAGNTAILKPASDSAACARVATKITEEFFSPEYVICLEGKSEITTMLMEEKLDYIFFTGSPKVGKIIQAAASKYLVPCTLELGGKSPAIVDETADIDQAAKRIIWCKLFNTGQICVTVDHVYVHRAVKQEFMAACRKYIVQFFGEDASQSDDYGFIINDRNFDRLVTYLGNGTTVYGGKSDKATRYIEPTLLDNIGEDDAVMQEEIFGPILPVLEFDDLEELIKIHQHKEKPLALYFFSKDAGNKAKIIRQTSSGGITINDCMADGGTNSLPFGGVGNSGMGSYHGKATFDVFTHYKAVMEAPTAHILDLPVKYPPYKGKFETIKKMEKFHIL
ncbi:aldehyde dehydrogenase [Spirosoma areae]